MAYYDRLVRDPEAALGEIAERRNLSRDELLSRLSAVRAAAQSGSHLTLGQAQSFFDDNQPPPPALAVHVDGCAYCQAMLDGLHPRRMQQGAERLREALAREADSVPVAAAPAAAALVRSKWLQPATGAVLGFALAVAVVAKPVAAYFGDSTELAELKAENAKLRDAVSEPKTVAMQVSRLKMPDEWEVVSATPNTIGGTSLQLTRSDEKGPTSVELTPGDRIVLLNVTQHARSGAIDAKSAPSESSKPTAASDSSTPVDVAHN